MSMCLSTSHLWCDFSVKGASVKCCSFPMLSSLRASFDWTHGCLNRWRHREPNQPCNPLLGLPLCFYRSTWRIYCTTMPCGSLEIRECQACCRFQNYLKSGFECVPRLRLQFFLFTSHSNDPPLSADYPDCCILSRSYISQMLPYCTHDLI